MIRFAILCTLTAVFGLAHAETVAEAYPPPDGATRITPDAFGQWLQIRRLLPSKTPITTYDGRVVLHDGRVVDLPLVTGDLQQCADSAIRLRAEWLRELNHSVMFHATSGDPIPWSRFRNGERPYELGGRIAWKPGGDRTWEGYLRLVFMWAGTRSLNHDTVAAGSPRPGDVLVVPGSPGHAVVLMDVATRGEQTFVLIGEGYMPAQSFHIEHGPIGGWWRWQEGVSLSHWAMPESGLRRFRSVD